MIEELTPEERQKLTRVTSKEFPSRAYLNSKQYTIEQSDNDLHYAANVLRVITHPDIYSAYISMLSGKNSSYGNHTWNVLGMKYLYGILFAKYLRYVECRSFDSLVDSFGYCVIALANYINHSGEDEQYNRVRDYFHDKYSGLKGDKLFIGVYGIFNNYYNSIWIEGNLSNKSDVLYFIFNLVLHMAHEYTREDYILGRHF